MSDETDVTTALAKQLTTAFVVQVVRDHGVLCDGATRWASVGDMFAVTRLQFVDEKRLEAETSAGKKLVANASCVRILCGTRLPDVEMHLHLVGHGYQADVYAKGEPVVSHCRDFGGTHPIRTLVLRAIKTLDDWLDLFRAGM